MCSLYTAVVKMKAKGNLFVNPTGSVHHQPASCIRTKGESAWYVRWKVQAIQGCQVHNKGWSFSDQNVNFGSSIEAVHQSNSSVSVAVLYHSHTELNILGYEAVFLQSNFILSVIFITCLHFDISLTKEFGLIQLLLMV